MARRRHTAGVVLWICDDEWGPDFPMIGDVIVYTGQDLVQEIADKIAAFQRAGYFMFELDVIRNFSDVVATPLVQALESMQVE